MRMKAILVPLLVVLAMPGVASAFPCLMQITGLITGGVLGCPGPTITRGAHYDCEACGVRERSGSIELTGTGQCLFVANYPIVQCDPYLISQTYLVKSARIDIQNVVAVPAPFFPCRDSSVSFREEECVCSECQHTPLVISLRDGRLRLTSLQEGVAFDLNANDIPERTSWIDLDAAQDDAFIVLDRNENGVIDSGFELFGDKSPQPPSESPNGYEALAVFDDALSGGNEDGRITAEDAVFERLQLWIDRNHNGVSEATELHQLWEYGVEMLGLRYWETGRVDEFGNEYKYRSFARVGNAVRPTWDVLFVSNEPIQGQSREQSFTDSLFREE